MTSLSILNLQQILGHTTHANPPVTSQTIKGRLVTGEDIDLWDTLQDTKNLLFYNDSTNNYKLHTSFFEGENATYKPYFPIRFFCYVFKASKWYICRPVVSGFFVSLREKECMHARIYT